MKRAILVLLVLANCAPEQKTLSNQCLQKDRVEGVVLARVGQNQITDQELLALIEDEGVHARKRYQDVNRIKRLVEDRVRFELLSLAAEERGLQNDPDVIEAARKVMVRKLLQRDMSTQVFPKVSDKRIQTYYETHKDDYTFPEKRRIGNITLAPTEAGLMLAQGILEKLQKAENTRKLFAQLQKQHSTTPLKKTPGLSELFQSKEEYMGAFGQHFTDTIFRAIPGELIGKPLQSIKGWHVVFLHAVREELTRGIDEVRQDIHNRLQKDIRSITFDKYLGKLKKRYPVAMYEQRYKSLHQTVMKTNNVPSTRKSSP